MYRQRAKSPPHPGIKQQDRQQSSPFIIIALLSSSLLTFKLNSVDISSAVLVLWTEACFNSILVRFQNKDLLSSLFREEIISVRLIQSGFSVLVNKYKSSFSTCYSIRKARRWRIKDFKISITKFILRQGAKGASSNKAGKSSKLFAKIKRITCYKLRFQTTSKF